MSELDQKIFKQIPAFAPHQVTFEKFLALFGDAFRDKGEAMSLRKQLKVGVYFPTYDAPVLRGTKKLMTADDFDDDVHDAIKTIIFGGPDNNAVAGMVCFECGDMSSSHLGERKGLIYGPGCTYKTLIDIWWQNEEQKITNTLDGELASTRKQPLCYYEKDPEDDPRSERAETTTSG
jgi:hypothetical protein